MKPFDKINKISEFIRNLVPSGCDVHFSTNQSDATAYLTKATSRIQVITARPEMRVDEFDSSVSTVFFVLQKDLGAGNTPKKEDEQYKKALCACEEIMDRIEAACTEEACGLMAGITVESYSLTPESSIFGNWKGYSLEINFS